MTLPLAGCRILEFCHFISGPSAAALLADQGAEVIKIEPLGGDVMRGVGPARNGISAAFITWNRNKSSIALDLGAPEGQAIIHRLVPEADVVLHNFRPGVVERLGIDAARLRALKPDLIYAAISGFGETGPYARRPAFDCVVQGLSGLGRSQMAGNTDEPHMIHNPLVDKLSGLVAAQAITAALYARAQTGKGGAVDVAMLDLAISFAWGDVMGRQTLVGDIPYSVTLDAGNWIHPTSDGVIVCQPTSEAQFQTLAHLAGRPDWLDDPCLATIGARSQNLDLFSQALKAAFRHRTTAEWQAMLDHEGIPHALALTPDEVPEDPQVRHNALILAGEHPMAGPVRECRAAARFDGEPMGRRRHAPALGEHTAEILRGAGFSDSEAATLRERGVVR